MASVAIDFEKQTATIVTKPGAKFSEEEAKKALTAKGYGISKVTTIEEKKDEKKEEKKDEKKEEKKP